MAKYVHTSEYGSTPMVLTEGIHSLNTRKMVRGRGTYKESDKGTTERRTEISKTNIPQSPFQNSFCMTTQMPSFQVQTFDTENENEIKESERTVIWFRFPKPVVIPFAQVYRLAI